MKRWGQVLLACALLLTLAACSGNGGEAEQTAAGAVKKVYYVSQDADSDTVLVKRLQKMGLEVTKVHESSLDSVPVDGHDLIFISNTAAHGRISGRFKQTPIPQFIQKPSFAYVAGLAAKQSDTGTAGDKKKIVIKDVSNPIVSGLSGTVDVYKSDGKIGYARPGQGAKIVATTEDDETRATIFYYDKGVKDASPLEVPAPARLLFFYVTAGEEMNQTDDSWKMFEAAVHFAMENK